MIVGLTGGIAVGKSTASKTFINHGIPVVDADQVARDVVVVGSDGLKCIINTFGTQYLLEDGSLNRNKLGGLVFADSAALSDLNKIMRPLIQNEAERQFNVLKLNHPIIIWDAALICEHGNADKYRPLVVVACPLEIQLSRLMSRNNLTHAEAMARINAQFSSEKRVEFADFVIDSSMSIKNSILQTEVVIYELKQLLNLNLVSLCQLKH